MYDFIANRLIIYPQTKLSKIILKMQNPNFVSQTMAFNSGNDVACSAVIGHCYQAKCAFFLTLFYTSVAFIIAGTDVFLN